MDKQGFAEWTRDLPRALLAPTLFSIACGFAASFNYLFFHSLAEIFSIVVAFTAMVVATTSARFSRNHFIVFVSIAIGWSGAIDLLHTLAFKGMHLLADDSANPATQLWLAARYLVAVALLLSPWALQRRFSLERLHLSFGLCTVALVGWVFSGHFPDAFIEDRGLTPFKIYSEVAIIALLGLSIPGLVKRRRRLSPAVFYGMLAAIVAMMLSELSFTLYATVHASANLIGHLLKIFAYWFVYTALVRNTIRDPFLQLQEQVRQREQLASAQDHLLAMHNERIKELRCINAVSELVERAELGLRELLGRVAPLLPPGFVLADKARACIESHWGNHGAPRPPVAPRRELTQPLLLGDTPVGTIRVWYPDEVADRRAEFLPEEQALLRNIARQLGDAIIRMQSLEQIQRFSYLYEMLSATSRSVVHSRNREELLGGLYESLVAHGTFPFFVFAETTNGSWPLRLGHHHGVPDELRPALAAVMADANSPLVGVVDKLKSGRLDSATIDQVYQGLSIGNVPDLVRWREFLQRQGIVNRVVLPLRSHGHLEAIVVLYASGLTAIDDEQLRLLQEVVDEMGFALDNFTRQAQFAETEKQASLLELRFQEVFKASPVPMQIMGLHDRRINAINDAHQRWLGYSLADIQTEEAWFKVIYPEHLERDEIRQHWEHALARAISGETVRSPDVTLRCKDGGRRYGWGQMRVVGDDAIVAWTDLTEIRNSERALLESERRFRTLVEQTVTAMFVRRDGRFIYINPRFAEISGWQAEDLIGKSVLDFTVQDSENIAQIRQAWAELHQSRNASLSYNVPFRRADGQIIQLGLTTKIITWDDGQPATIVLAADITEKKRAEQQIAAYVQQLEGAMRGTLQAVSTMVEMRDPYTAGHERRVGLIASAIARELGWNEELCRNLELLGLVHDIGKISIPSEILTKPTRLSPLEMEMMKGHAQAGYEILKDVPFAVPVAEIIRQHHERMDGSGYPQGLTGDRILPEARVLAVADVLESMASHRPYRPALGLEVALAEVEKNRGKLYAPEVVDAAIRLVREKGYLLPA